jgi:serine protease AprX
VIEAHLAVLSSAVGRSPAEILIGALKLQTIRLIDRIARSALVFLPLICFGGPPKVAPDLTKADPHSRVNVIIQFNLPPSGDDTGAIDQLGGQQQADLGLIRSKVYTVPAAALAGIAHNPHVAYISPDRVLSPTLDYANGAIGAQTAFSAGWMGAGVGVAVIDSGIGNQPDLVNRIVYSQSFVPNVSTTIDQYGHGTHVAGIVAGNGAASTGTPYVKTFRGVAPKANLINLRVLDANGAGTDSAVISAINTAIQLKTKYNIRVINLSVGRPVFESYTLDPLCQAVEQAWNAGIVVVVAAGNAGRDQSQGTDGYATITAPGNDPLVITVGAMKTMGTLTRADDLIASYSSKGPTLLDHVVKPDIVAPGNRIISLEASKTTVLAASGANYVPFSYYQNPSNKGNSPDYFKLSGTSMAAPMVSGTVALMLNKDSSLTPDTIKARLMKTATKTFPLSSTATDPVTLITYTSQYDMFTIGAGYLDAWAALNSSDSVPAGSTAASPIAVFNSSNSSVTVVNAGTPSGQHAVWGSMNLWGATAVWGTSLFLDGSAALWGTSAIWGSTAVWGTAGPSGNTAVWGTHAVWGSTTSDNGESTTLLTNGEN